MNKLDYFEMLFDLLTFKRQDELLSGYIEAMHDERELWVPGEGTEKEKAVIAMMDNVSDCNEILARHIGFCMRSLSAEPLK